MAAASKTKEANGEGYETCFCGAKVTVSSRWSSVMGFAKPTPFGLVVGRPVSVSKCLSCNEALCVKHAEEHKSPDTFFSKIPFIWDEHLTRASLDNKNSEITEQVLIELEANLQRDLPPLLPDGPICRHCIRRRHDLARHRRQRIWLWRLRSANMIQFPDSAEKEASSRDIKSHDYATMSCGVVDGENQAEDMEEDNYEFIYPLKVEEDTVMAKAGRVVDGTYKVAQYIPGLDTTISLVIGATSMARQYGMYGLAGLVHREELTKAVTTLRLLVGERYVQSLSVQDTAIGLYYLTAFRRSWRGSDPFSEEKLHRSKSAARKSCVVNDRMLQHLEEVASICQHCYQSKPHEMERLALLCHNLKLVASMPASSVLHPTPTTSISGIESINEYSYELVPAFQLFIRNAPDKTAFLVVRGTADISDAMLDAAAVPVRVEVNDNGDTVKESLERVKQSEISTEMKDSSDKQSKGYRVLKRPKKTDGTSKDKDFWAHNGINFAASWIESEVRPILSALVRTGYHLIITGHSLGAAVASLLHGRLTNKIKAAPYIMSDNVSSRGEFDERGLFDSSECIGFGTPPIVSEALALRLSQASKTKIDTSIQEREVRMIGFPGQVLTVVNRDDVVCRASAYNARLLVEDVIHGKDQWHSSMKLDVQSVALRATTLWAPRVRGGRKESDADPTKHRLQASAESRAGSESRSGSEGRAAASRPSLQYHASLHGPLSIENDIRSIEMSGQLSEARGRSSSPSGRLGRSSSRSRGKSSSRSESGQVVSEKGAAFGSYLSSGEEDQDEIKLPMVFHDDVKEQEEVSRNRSLSHLMTKTIWSSSSSSSDKQVSNPLENETTVGSVAPTPTLEATPLAASVDKPPPHDVEALSVKLVVPGRILHMYKRMGASIPALTPAPVPGEVVPPCLDGIDPHVAMVDDHYLQRYIQEIRNCRATLESGLCFIGEDDKAATHKLSKECAVKVKIWKPFATATVCEICRHDFTWESTSSSPAQRLMDMHHCRSCGGVVCAACASKKRPLNELGMPLPVRVCDKCFYRPRPTRKHES